MSFPLPATEAAKLERISPLERLGPDNAPTPPPPGIGLGQAAAAALRTDWTPDDTERWLTDFPLPATFKWNGERADPRYRLKKGYGFWLRTSGPFHPALRGLFMLCHDVLATLRPGLDPMPEPEQLAALLLKRARPAEELPWSDDDRRKIQPGVPNPAEFAPTFDPSDTKPTGNPPATDAEPSPFDD